MEGRSTLKFNVNMGNCCLPSPVLLLDSEAKYEPSGPGCSKIGGVIPGAALGRSIAPSPKPGPPTMNGKVGEGANPGG